MTNLVLFHAPCGGLGAYTWFRGQTRVPTVTNLFSLMYLAVVLVPAGCLFPHGGRRRGRLGRGSGRGLGGARATPVLRAKKGGRIANVLKWWCRDQVGPTLRRGESKSRCNRFLVCIPSCLQIKICDYRVASEVTGTTA